MENKKYFLFLIFITSCYQAAGRPLLPGYIQLKNGQNLAIKETAILIVDMWDKHWCSAASQRTDEMAIKMAPLIQLARKKGIQIIHAPSDTMGNYEGTIQRINAMLTPYHTPYDVITIRRPPLPIDASDGGCDDPNEPFYKAWSHENPRIDMGEFDIVSDDGGEIYNYLIEENIKNIIFMGVHANMCILDRPFGIRAIKQWGFNVLFARDLTDTMYSPRTYPYVSHNQGTQLVIKYIEQNYALSVTSDELTRAFNNLSSNE